jgi:hypothetical protein
MRTWFVAASVFVGLFVPQAARAQEATTSSTEPTAFRLDDYCERVREAGKSTAAVLLGPRVGVQAIKFPAGGDLVLGQTTASETQLRGYTQYSITDAVHGILALKLGEAECRRQRLAQPLEDAIRVATDQGRRLALSREMDFLKENDEVVAGLEREAEARQRAEVGTLQELIEIQTLASAFRAQEAETEDELSRLDASALHEATLPLAQQAADYEKASMDVERLGSRIRQITPWTFSVNGGLAANGVIPVDWFGTVELSYNLGGLLQSAAEPRLLSARERELQSASYELVYAARVVDAALSESVAHLKRQISVVEKEVDGLRAEETLLEGSDTPGRLTLIAVVKLRLLAVQARLVYSRALAEQRRPWESQS